MSFVLPLFRKTGIYHLVAHQRSELLNQDRLEEGISKFLIAVIFDAALNMMRLSSQFKFIF